MGDTEADQPKRDRNLDGCEEFIAAMLQRDLPPSFKALSDTPEIWPNNWGQDVAMAAFMVHKDAETIANLRGRLGEAISLLSRAEGWIDEDHPLWDAKQPGTLEALHAEVHDFIGAANFLSGENTQTQTAK